MKGLKIILWICAIEFLLAFILAPLPWRAIIAWCQWIGIQPPAAEPITVFMFRISFAMFGMIGIFFVILAKNPLKYGAMVQLSAIGLFCYGVLGLVLGLRYGLPAWIYLDAIFGLVLGGLIFAFQKEAIQSNSN